MHTPLYRSRPGGFDLRPASMPEALRINDFVYASHGLSNSYLVLTSEGRVVINTGMGFEAPVHKRNYDAVKAITDPDNVFRDLYTKTCKAAMGLAE